MEEIFKVEIDIIKEEGTKKAGWEAITLKVGGMHAGGSILRSYEAYMRRVILLVSISRSYEAYSKDCYNLKVELKFVAHNGWLRDFIQKPFPQPPSHTHFVQDYGKAIELGVYEC